MKRFYRTAAVATAEGGFTVELDGRAVRTPRKALLVLPNAALAEAVAAEWTAQEAEIRPTTMPQTRLAATAIDRVGPERERVAAIVAGYGASDLVCYHAADDARLWERQEACWRPLRDWLAARHGVVLRTAQGIVPVVQETEALARLSDLVAAHDDLALTALHDFTTITGSLVIALALSEGQIRLEAAWQAAFVDELHQAATWGEDAEAAARRARLREELGEALRFLDLARAQTEAKP